MAAADTTAPRPHPDGRGAGRVPGHRDRGPTGQAGRFQPQQFRPDLFEKITQPHVQGAADGGQDLRRRLLEAALDLG
jgi:hypothetical protein